MKIARITFNTGEIIEIPKVRETSHCDICEKHKSRIYGDIDSGTYCIACLKSIENEGKVEERVY